MKSSNKAIPMPISSYHSDIGKVYSFEAYIVIGYSHSGEQEFRLVFTV